MARCGAQVRTITGVVRSVGVFLIVSSRHDALKDAFNINVEPLLASAGIAGLAIGFGAQTLVKDVITDSSFSSKTVRGGRYHCAAGVTGVEEITMRRTTLRVRCTLHIVPNGSIQIVSNHDARLVKVTLHVQPITAKTVTASWSCCRK